MHLSTLSRASSNVPRLLYLLRQFLFAVQKAFESLIFLPPPNETGYFWILMVRYLYFRIRSIFSRNQLGKTPPHQLNCILLPLGPIASAT